MLKVTNITGATDDGDPVTVTVTVEQAERAGVPVATGPARPDPVFGSTLAPTDFAELWHGGRADRAEFCRTYSGTGEGILPWTSPRRMLPSHVVDFHSWTDWPSDTAVVSWLTDFLDTIPSGLMEAEALLPQLRPCNPDGYGPAGWEYDGFSVLLSYWHAGEQAFAEHQGSVAEWRRRHALAYRVIRQHPNGRRVGYMPVQTNTWTEARSTPGFPRGDFDPLAWWAGVGDFAGYTVYVPLGDPPMPHPYNLLSVPNRLANGSGRPLFLAEVGVAGPGGEPGGTWRADWIRDFAQEARAAGVAGMGWLDALSPLGWDLRLLDEPSAQAWKSTSYGL